MSLPHFPLEIWVHILGSVTDARYLPRLWLDGRRVSRAFRAATEQAFAHSYLPRMRICVELAELLELSFAGFSPPGEEEKRKGSGGGGGGGSPSNLFFSAPPGSSPSSAAAPAPHPAAGSVKEEEGERDERHQRPSGQGSTGDLSQQSVNGEGISKTQNTNSRVVKEEGGGIGARGGEVDGGGGEQSREKEDHTARAYFRQLRSAARQHPDGTYKKPLRMPSELRDRLERAATERVWSREHARHLHSLATGSPTMLYTVWLGTNGGGGSGGGGSGSSGGSSGSGGCMVEDPGFPGLEVDIAGRMLSFRWRPLLTSMFGEIEYRKWAFRREVLAAETVTENREEKEEEDGTLAGVGDVSDSASPTATTTTTTTTTATAETTQRGSTEALRGPKSARSGKDQSWDYAHLHGLELQARRRRRRNRVWSRTFESDRRQEWLVNALMAYRTQPQDHGLGQEEEEGWGTFYDR
ncbi:hypothetical protein BX600DRAFT_507301 [Xylariales sp. PMI_506]|nr:hypothetical protein BX600DRAFT_507301 [Xylariales sp. PMI_506]